MAAERYYPTIPELPENDRPRERLLEYGVNAVSNAELLAIILRVGTRDENAVVVAQNLLRRYGTLAAIAQASTEELAEARGVGPAKVAQLKAALELGRRMLAETPDMKPQIRSPADAANLVMSEMCWLDKEHLRTILLDTKNRVVAKPTVYQGSLNTSLIRVGELFREAIRANCAAMIVVHNHPSGDPTPSPEDVAVTRQIAEAGKLLDVEVLDHLIIGQQRFVSLKERGLGFG
ncbi:MAG TPA: DNA repair protein RadC [Anaerolineae bacterium]|nr:DNA repair protein RadC [Anaerolineae bacterium]